MNTEEFAHKDLQVSYGGRLVTGIQDVKFSEDWVQEHIMASGNKAHTIGTGNLTVTGSIKMLMSEALAIYELAQSVAKGQVGLLSLDLFMGLVPQLGDQTAFFQVKTVKFEKFEVNIAQGQTSIPVEFPFKAIELKKL